MEIVPINSIIVGQRQRKKIEDSHVVELRESILARGLIHAPVVHRTPAGTYELIAGETRFRAISDIKQVYFHDNTPIEPGHIPVTLVSDFLSPAGRFELEFDENKRRRNLSWQDEVDALSNMHSMLAAENPRQTFSDTARTIVDESLGIGAQAPTFDQSAETPHLSTVRTNVAEAVRLAPHLSNPTIAKARNASEAYTLLMKQENERYTSALARKTLQTMPKKATIELVCGDALVVMPTLKAEFVDLILCDVPYGIDAGASGFRSRTVHHHNYTDDMKSSRELQTLILTEGFRVTKPRANIFMFNDIKHFEWWQYTAANLGWVPFRRPLIWGKSDSEGLAPWGSQGPRLTTDFIFFATKGQRGLISSPTDYLRFDRVDKAERVHAAEKPTGLLEKLICCATLPGDMVFDPCCGSGSTLVAAQSTKRFGLGIEKDQQYYDLALAQVHGDGTNAQSAGGDT